MNWHAILKLGSLEPAEVLFKDGTFETPAHLKMILGGGRVTLPNASVCSDFLVLPSGEIVGVCVAVSTDDLPLVRSLFRKANAGRVTIRESTGFMPKRYSDYPGWNWLEVTWKEASDANLVVAQSLQALWLLNNDSPQCLAAMVLEHLDYIEGETEGFFTFEKKD
jgi:hypothetical protein